MVSQQRAREFTEAEYLLIEKQANYKSEFLYGQIYAMAGGTPEHSQIAANIIGELRNRLKGRPCRTFTSDLRVKVQATTLNTYPDVTIICGQPMYEGDTLLNPTVIFEVLSSSTEAEDRGFRFEHLRQIPSLQHYILVAQDRPRLECFSRQSDETWPCLLIEGITASLSIPALDCDLPLSEVYDQLTFPPAEENLV